MNDILIGISYRHNRATTLINYKPLYCSIIFISLVEVRLSFIGISKNQKHISYKHVQRKVPQVLRNQPCILRLLSISLKESNEPPPCFDIEY